MEKIINQVMPAVQLAEDFSKPGFLERFLPTLKQKEEQSKKNKPQGLEAVSRLITQLAVQVESYYLEIIAQQQANKRACSELLDQEMAELVTTVENNEAVEVESRLTPSDLGEAAGSTLFAILTKLSKSLKEQQPVPVTKLVLKLFPSFELVMVDKARANAAGSGVMQTAVSESNLGGFVVEVHLTDAKIKGGINSSNQELLKLLKTDALLMNTAKIRFLHPTNEKKISFAHTGTLYRGADDTLKFSLGLLGSPEGLDCDVADLQLLFFRKNEVKPPSTTPTDVSFY